MTEELNISEILKGKSKGTKLYSPIFGECEYKTIIEHTCKGDTDSIKVKVNYSEVCFDEAGKYIFNGILSHDDREPLLFPSKEMRDWSKFAWKKGNVLISNDGKVKVIFEKFRSDTYQSFIGKHHLDNLDDKNLHYQDEGEYPTFNFSLESEDAAQTYINTIEERLGGKLNRETLEVKKPKFKDGDIVSSEIRFIDSEDVIVETYIVHNDYLHGEKLNYYVGYNGKVSMIDYNSVINSENTSVKNTFLRYATEEEKKQLFDALAKEGKAWDSEKKQIVDLKPKVKPFDRVLVRDSKSDNWRANLFGYIGKDGYYHCVYANWAYCIPYNEETAHLLGTTDEWKGGEG